MMRMPRGVGAVDFRVKALVSARSTWACAGSLSSYRGTILSTTERVRAKNRTSWSLTFLAASGAVLLQAHVVPGKNRL